MAPDLKHGILYETPRTLNSCVYRNLRVLYIACWFFATVMNVNIERLPAVCDLGTSYFAGK